MQAPNRTLAILLGIVATILVGWVLNVGASILQPLVIALLLASMLQPVVRNLARWRIPPTVTVIALASALFFGLVRLGILVQVSVMAFVGQPVESVLDPVGPTSELTGPAGLDWDQVVDKIGLRLTESDLPPALAHTLLNSLRELELASVATELVGSGFDLVRGAFMVVLYMLFIFAEQAIFRRKILSVAGERRQEAAQLLDTIGRGIQRYLGVKTVASLATGTLCYFALVKLEVPYALLFAFLTYILNYIPTFGSIIAGAFPAVTALAVHNWWTALFVVAVYLAVNLTIGSYLEPKVLGRELNLSPLVIVISVVVWAGVWGVVGAFLAVPLTSTLQIALAASETTRPIAVLLSSGPPREERRRRAAERAARKASDSRASP